MKFRLVIDKAKDEEILATVHECTHLIEEIESLVNTSEHPTQINGYGEDDIKVLNITQIESVYVEDGKTYALYFDGNVYRLKNRLYEIEEILPPEFVRINKSAIANKKRIKRFKTQLTGAVDIEFKSGKTDYVSRRCFAELRKEYGI
jgi:DNA-binding LytR/AlgR family response regulator